MAFGIMSMVLAVVVPGQSKLLQRSTTISDTNDAMALAYSRLALKEYPSPFPEVLAMEDKRGWSLYYIVEPQPLTPSGQNAEKISVTIMDEKGDELATVNETRIIK